MNIEAPRAVRDLHDLPLTLTVEQFAHAIGIGRTSAWEAVRRGDVRAVRIGHRVVIPRHELARLLGIDDPADASVEQP